MCMLQLYPRRWRRRYEAEVRAVLEQHRVRPATLADLLAAAVDARLEQPHRSEEAHMPKSTRRDRGKVRGYRQVPVRCSFCGKSRDEVNRLVAGPGVYICDGCVKLCNQVISGREGPEGGWPSPATPRQRPKRVQLLRAWLRNLLRSAPLPSSATPSARVEAL